MDKKDKTSKILTILCIIAYGIAIVFISIKNIEFGIVFVFLGALLFFALLINERWIAKQREREEADSSESTSETTFNDSENKE